jgi:hypothetical protein
MAMEISVKISPQRYQHSELSLDQDFHDALERARMRDDPFLTRKSQRLIHAVKSVFTHRYPQTAWGGLTKAEVVTWKPDDMDTFKLLCTEMVVASRVVELERGYIDYSSAFFTKVNELIMHVKKDQL